MRAADRYISRGRLEDGIRQHLAIAEENPGDLTHLNRVGDLLVRAGRAHRAVALFLKVGRAYAEQGFLAKAIAIYQKVLRCDPRRPGVEAELAKLYLRSGLPVDERALHPGREMATFDS